ncbi:FAD-dependent monooxygenase [Pseudonocardia hierapolitana]|uniref:FAD-dependent monooxygenase n=1 Tax=Pseudonocardia hierapolitana TaxID=1128676 RepID=UPI00147966D3|nr:FAD-dependent monooxygenase [Pseudonocardia hierapolitana]
MGAGPAGLVLARLLQRAGIPVTVFERRSRAELTAKPGAGLIEYRSVELLRSVGIADVDLEFTIQNGRMEFRTPTASTVFDYGGLTGGRTNYIYPQHQLVGALCDALVADGGDVRFSTPIAAVRQNGDGVVVMRADGSEIRAQAVVGCEGAHSVVATAMTGLRTNEVDLPARIVAVIADAPPLEEHTIYGLHPRGFAGQMRRGPQQTRYYVEVPGTDTAADWPEDRIREELGLRLDIHGKLDGVPFSEPVLVDLRVRVNEPMQDGRLFLAGDAAHLITAAAGKGMNLAIQDAVELAAGLIDRLGPAGDDRRLAAYSATRLPAIWRTEAFSLWYLRILLAGLHDGTEPAGTVPGGFTNGAREGWLAALLGDPLLARWFAHAYAGVDTSP